MQSDSSVGEKFCGGLAVFSGPSGSGKTSICSALLQDPRIRLSVSATTRQPRSGETHGVEYYFYSRERFQQMIEAGEFVEWAEVYGKFYGTPSAPLIEAANQEDYFLLLDIDVQGAAQLREQKIPATFFFVAPPSMDVLKTRLQSRGTDDAETVARRLSFAQNEMAKQSLYDYVLVNDDLDATIRRAKELLRL